MRKLLVSTVLWILLTSNVFAHHSFAPHFDRDQPINISGIITEYEQRNPHAYLNIRAEDADGRVKEWRCESHGYTQLARNGITPDMLTEGSQVGVTGSQHRRDPNMCFFDVVYLEDGRELSVNGPRNRQQGAEEQRNSIYGTWMLLPNVNFTSSGPQSMYDFLTPAGQAYADLYNPLTDDPAYRCSPVAIRRAWAAPSTPVAISRVGGNILIKHEWMDIERVIHMDQDDVPEGVEPSVLGYSVGHFDGDNLVIETSRYSEGWVNQYVTLDDGSLSGVPHSDGLQSVERVSFDPDRNRLSMTLEQTDDAFFTQNFPMYSREYGPTALDIAPFGCIPELLK